jgi:hypothetical protein
VSGGVRRCAWQVALPLAAGLSIVAAGRVQAQSAFAASLYGELRSPAPPRQLALGGLGGVAPFGLPSTEVGVPNPALTAFADQVRFSVVWEVGRLGGSYADGPGVLWQLNPRLAGLLLPFGRGWAGGITLQSRTTSDFEIHTDEEEVAGYPVRFDYQGTGGLNRGTISLAWRDREGILAAGIGGHILFGVLKQQWMIDFIGSGLVDTADRLHRQHFGYRISSGVQVSPRPGLRVGVVYDSPARLQVRQIYGSMAYASDDTSRGRLRLGGAVQAAMGWRFAPQWAAYADWRSEAWDRARWEQPPTDLSGWGLPGIGFDGVQAETDWGIGLEREARPIFEQRSLLDAYPLRAGIRLGRLYAPDRDGGRVRQACLTVGSSFQLGTDPDGGRADVVLVYGSRWGTTGVSERYWRIQVGVNGTEKWFQSPQR